MTPFSEHLAARVHELERELKNTRAQLVDARKSRDVWKLRYEWASTTARRVVAVEKCRRYRERQAA